MTITILKGLPASGKSTWVKEFRIGFAKVINKDLLREMLDGGAWSKENEQIVLQIRDSIIIDCILLRKNIIIDDTNLDPKHEKRIRQIADYYSNLGEPVNVIVKDDFLKVPLEECIERDGKRPNPVGKKVIEDMYNRYVLPTITKELPTKDAKLPKAVIFDIDGTLAHKCDRDIYDGSKAIDDYLDENVYMFLNSLVETGIKIIICSGRDGRYEVVTRQWLLKNNVYFNEFYIRAAGDKRKDSIVKREFLADILTKYNPILAVDDRNQVVKMWRDAGIKCWQVCDGDY